jgi:hypothetical protein
MRLRRRFSDDDPGPQEAALAEGSDLDALRAAGEEFLRAADDAISRALSGDSERFLEAARQQGGE